jgi:polysaccharide export outer membrane protein
MKHFGLRRVISLMGVVYLLFVQLGCATTGPQTNVGPPIDTTYRPGDEIVIDFDVPGIPNSWPQTVREDGTITLPLLSETAVAAGKQKGELEQAIHALYVPEKYRRMTVNIRSKERSYFVRGEVKLPRQRHHTGSITALQAISAAGDFTDYANRNKIDVIRATGEKIRLNGEKALKTPSLDIPVYPNDTVYVYRRIL